LTHFCIKTFLGLLAQSPLRVIFLSPTEQREMVFVVAGDGMTQLSADGFVNYGLIEEMTEEHGSEVIIPLPDIDSVTLAMIFDTNEMNMDVELNDTNTAQVIAGIIYLKADASTMDRWASRLPVNYPNLISNQYLDVLWRDSNIIPLSCGNSDPWKKVVVLFCNFIGVDVKQELYICHLIEKRLCATNMTIQDYCNNMELGDGRTIQCAELINIIHEDTLHLLPASLFTRTFEELGASKTIELFKFYCNREVTLPNYTCDHVMHQLNHMRKLALEEDNTIPSVEGQALLFGPDLSCLCCPKKARMVGMKINYVFFPTTGRSHGRDPRRTARGCVSLRYVEDNLISSRISASLNKLTTRFAGKVITIPRLNIIAGQLVERSLAMNTTNTIVVFFG
jgi:hypothetical protein